MHQKFAGLIPILGTYLGYRLDLIPSGYVRETSDNVSLSYINVSLSLPSSLYKNQ